MKPVYLQKLDAGEVAATLTDAILGVIAEGEIKHSVLMKRFREDPEAVKAAIRILLDSSRITETTIKNGRGRPAKMYRAVERSTT
jgi:predicted ArsR family transcriptional regulator